MLRETSELYSLIHHSYSLMTNHTHFISTPKQPSSLYLTMRDLFGSCASYFNHKHGLSGRLWQGRFYSTVLDETHFWAAIRYVERNPVRAGMVLRAEEYEWSAAPAHCGLRHDPILWSRVSTREARNTLTIGNSFLCHYRAQKER
jgi:putative transposase